VILARAITPRYNNFMHPILFKIGAITIYTYGFFVFLGAMADYLVGQRQADKAGISRQHYSDIFFWAAVAGFVGARLLYLIVEWPFFMADPWAAVSARAGFVFYGGLLAGIPVILFLAKKFKIDFFKLADVLILGIPLGHALGRVGCFFYGCCYGRHSEKWGMMFPSDSPAGMEGVKVIPTQLVEAVVLTGIFFILLAFNRRKKLDGQLTGVYLVLYGIARFFLEYLRDDARGSLGMLSTSQLISLAIIVAGVGFLMVCCKRLQKSVK
jgi:phosphatidylglycerol:prolipoprotein diacylglycerol transferase